MKPRNSEHFFVPLTGDELRNTNGGIIPIIVGLLAYAANTALVLGTVAAVGITIKESFDDGYDAANR